MKSRVSLIAMALLPLATLAVSWSALPWMETSTFPICLFKIAMGRPCLFCGLTHAFAYAAHGRFEEATRHHPLWWLFAAGIGIVALNATLDLFTGAQRISQLCASIRISFVPVAVFLVVFSVLRWAAA